MSPASRAALEAGFGFEQAGRLDEAFASFERAVALDPTNGRAWRQLGNLLRHAGRLGDAGACFERAIACSDDAALNRFFLSALGIGPLVPEAPVGFVAALYDQYAPRFEKHLVDGLTYAGPERLLALFAPDLRFGSMLDLGCGTGLAGQAFRARVERLEGVDVSARMLEHARATGAYDLLLESDLLAHLREAAGHHDLVVAADVFIYRGDLLPVFRGVRRLLAPGGRFAFTVESCGAPEGYDHLPTLRYAHSEAYLRGLAELTGFEVRGLVSAPLRTQDGVPIEGLYADLKAAD